MRTSSPCSILCLHALSRNIVATVNLDCRLDLKTIALHARNAEYNPKVSCRIAGSFTTTPLCFTTPR